MNTSLYIKRLYVTALISVVAFTATLAQEFTVNGLNYELTSTENREVKVTGGEIREEIIIPETVTYDNVKYTVTRIADNAFSGRTDQSNFTRRYVIPGSVKSLGNRAFYDNYYLEEVVFNKGLETIGEWAFGYARELKEIVIPSTVVSIANSAFYTDWDRAINIVCYSATTTIGDHTFRGRTHIATLHVPSDELTAFQAADYWKDFANIETFTKEYISKPHFSFDEMNLLLTMESSTPGTKIYFTIDGSDPTTQSTLYTEPIRVLRNGIDIRAIAVADGRDNSKVSRYDYTLRLKRPSVSISSDNIITIIE